VTQGTQHQLPLQPARAKHGEAGLSNRTGLTAILTMLVVFAFFALTWQTAWMQQFDDSVGDTVRMLRSDALTPIFVAITDMGETVPILIVAAVFILVIFFVLRLRWQILALLAASVLLSWGTNSILKRLFERARPTVEHLSFADGFSFPSAHAMVSSTFYGLIAYVLWRYLRSKGRTGAARAVAVVGIVWIALICVSRIYLGVHYPSDIIAGASIGVAWWLASVLVMKRVGR